MSLLVMLFVSRLVDPLVILAGVVPYFGIRNAPVRSFAGAAGAGAFVGIIYDARTIFEPTSFALSLLATVAAACAWWSILHWGRKFIGAKARDSKAADRSRGPRLVRDE